MRHLQKNIGVEGHGGHEVDDVDGRLQELALVRTDNETDADLQREPNVADKFDVEEGIVRLCRPVNKKTIRQKNILGVDRAGLSRVRNLDFSLWILGNEE